VITKNHITRLDEGKLLNDQLIDFKIRHLINSTKKRKIEEVFAYNSLFWPAYDHPESSGYDSVRRWTSKTKVDIFEKEMVIIPISAYIHWSLIIILNTDMIFVEESERTDDPYILSFDSLNYHNSEKHIEKLRLYLFDEYINKICGGKLEREVEIKSFIDNIKHVNMNEHIPSQENGFDCGIYVCKFVDIMLEKCVSRTGVKINDDYIKSHFVDLSFTAKDALIERGHMKELVKSVEADMNNTNNNKSPTSSSSSSALVILESKK
tara:strand:+ start:2212 stop:3006 length:795 start_codon:yes stop_codon:yes gene_type:complete